MRRKGNSEMQQMAKFMKRQLVFSRIIGVLFCLLCAGTLALMYFEIFDHWTCMMIISFSLAGIFISNSYLQGIKTGKKWQVLNMVLAFICYCAVIVFVVIGFVQGTIKFGF